MIESVTTVALMLVTVVGTGFALLSVPGTLELAWLTLGGLLPERRRRKPASGHHLEVAVVVPAHNEQELIGRCVRSLLACSRNAASFKTVVVADNCTDETAEQARISGARVLERRDPSRRGKGHALGFAFARLIRENFDAFVVVDADSVVPPNFVDEIAGLLKTGADAVQVPYGVLNPNASVRARLMSVALLAFNRLRLRGRAGWGVSVGILGNGFALSRATLCAVPYDAHSIVEDLEYHLRLVRSGRRVVFAGRTQVLADMPVGTGAAVSQRARWEGGRFRMIREHSARLVRGVLAGRWALAEPLFELLLLPLAFHVCLLLAAFLAPLMAVQAYALVGLSVVAFHVLLAVVTGGGGWRDLAVLAAAPVYVLWKILRLPSIFRSARGETSWVRTARETNPEVVS